MRALELAEAGASLVAEDDRLWSGSPRRPTLVVGLDVPEEALALRIEARAREMFDRGVVEEARRALAGPVSRTAEKALGLRELAELPRDEAFERIVAQDASLRRLPAQVDAAHPGHRHDRRRPTPGRGGQCDSRSGTRSVTPTCSSSGPSSRLRSTPDEVRRLCDPRYGIGSDGILEIVRGRGAEADVVVWNPDGSRAELSGNGARIAALWLARRSGVAFPRVRLGERLIPARVDGDDVEVDLGPGRRRAPRGARARRRAPRVHARLGREPARRRSGGSRSARSSCVSARSSSATSASRERTNVQLVRADAPGDLTVLVWERGAGETLASGSSAAAAAAAAVTHGWCESPVRVHLPGGTVTVDIREGRAILSGPVVEIAVGETVS